MAVVDYFLKIDGIEGESLQKGHEREIEISGFEWSCENSGSFAANLGGGSGKVKMRDFQFQVPVNRASPKLFLACCTGEHIKKATLSCRKAGKEAQEYLKWTFTDLLISSYSVVAGDDSGNASHGHWGGWGKMSIGGGVGSTMQPQATQTVPVDLVGFNFTKIEVSYAPQKADGSLEAPILAGLDLKRGVKIII